MAAKGEFADALQLCLKNRLSEADKELAEAIRYSLLAPGKHVRPRSLLATAEMMSLKKEAALPFAIALEMIHCSALIHDDLPFLNASEIRRGQPAAHKKFGQALTVLAGDALLGMAFDVAVEASPHVEPRNFARGLGRLARCAGPTGVAGGQAERMGLTPESTLDELKRVNARRSAMLFSAAILGPMDLAGIADDSSQGLALDIFARELGLAFQVMDDFKQVFETGRKSENPGKDLSPAHILYYLPAKEAKSMTLQRLNSATLSLSSAWGSPAQTLVQIAEEITRDIEAAPES